MMRKCPRCKKEELYWLESDGEPHFLCGHIGSSTEPLAFVSETRLAGTPQPQPFVSGYYDFENACLALGCARSTGRGYIASGMFQAEIIVSGRHAYGVEVINGLAEKRGRNPITSF